MNFMKHASTVQDWVCKGCVGKGRISLTILTVEDCGYREIVNTNIFLSRILRVIELCIKAEVL